MATIPVQLKYRSASENSHKKLECPECGTEYLRTAEEFHEVVCSACNTVIEQPIQRNRESVYGPEDESNLRTGGTVDLGEVRNGIGTNQCPDDKWRLTFNPHDDAETKRRQRGLSDIEHYGRQLGLEPYEIGTAKRWYQEAHSQGLLAGRDLEGFVACCLLAGIRKSSRSVPLRIADILDATPSTNDQLQTARRAFFDELGRHLEPLSPGDLLVRANHKLDVPTNVLRFTKKLIERCQKEIVNLPPTPQTRAAVLLTVSYNTLDISDAPTQAEIAEALGVSESVLSTKKRAFLGSSQAMVQEMKRDL